MRVRVLWAKEAVQQGDWAGWNAAVVDCLRATSSIAVALSSGARSVTPVDGEEEARHRASALAAAGQAVLLAGERDAVRIPGFEAGNSPGEFLGERAAGRTVVLATTNGSRALAWSAAATGGALAFSLLNLGVVAGHLAASAPERLLVVCSGTLGRFALDDAFCAGALLDRLEEAGCELACDDAGRAARLLHRAGLGQEAAFLASTQAGRYLLARGFADDVSLCAQVDRFPVLPLWSGGALVAG